METPSNNPGYVPDHWLAVCHYRGDIDANIISTGHCNVVLLPTFPAEDFGGPDLPDILALQNLAVV